MKPSRLSEIGEQNLIRRIRGWCGPGFRSPHFKVETDNGDDAFVAKLTSNPSIAITTDTMLEGTHFRLDWKSPHLKNIDLWESLGSKAMVSNLSDLAAMGHVQPLFAFITLGLHGDISVDNVDNLYRGIRKWLRLFRFNVAGGDIIRSDKSMISITLVGKKLSPKCVSRSGAKNGDLIMVSGPLGLSHAGLLTLQKQRRLPPALGKRLILAHLFPAPEMRAGALLASEAILATSMLDTSDDLLTSLEILSRSSRVGLEIELSSVSYPPALREAARHLGLTPAALFLQGGEDYKLLFTLPQVKAEAALRKIPGSSIIGRVTPAARGIRILQGGKPARVANLRFRHF